MQLLMIDDFGTRRQRRRGEQRRGGKSLVKKHSFARAGRRHHCFACTLPRPAVARRHFLGAAPMRVSARAPAPSGLEMSGRRAAAATGRAWRPPAHSPMLARCVACWRGRIQAHRAAAPRQPTLGNAARTRACRRACHSGGKTMAAARHSHRGQSMARAAPMHRDPPNLAHNHKVANGAAAATPHVPPLQGRFTITNGYDFIASPFPKAPCSSRCPRAKIVFRPPPPRFCTDYRSDHTIRIVTTQSIRSCYPILKILTSEKLTCW